MTKNLWIETDSDRAPMLILTHKSIKAVIIKTFIELNTMLIIQKWKVAERSEIYNKNKMEIIKLKNTIILIQNLLAWDLYKSSSCTRGTKVSETWMGWMDRWNVTFYSFSKVNYHFFSWGNIPCGKPWYNSSCWPL